MEPLDGVRVVELEADQARQEVTFVQAAPTLERRLDRQMHALERRMYARAAIVGGLGVAAAHQPHQQAQEHPPEKSHLAGGAAMPRPGVEL